MVSRNQKKKGKKKGKKDIRDMTYDVNLQLPVITTQLQNLRATPAGVVGWRIEAYNRTWGFANENLAEARRCMTGNGGKRTKTSNSKKSGSATSAGDYLQACNGYIAQLVNPQLLHP